MKIKILLFTIAMALISISIFTIGPDRLSLLYYKIKNGSSFDFNGDIISVHEYTVVGVYINKGQLVLSSPGIIRYDPIILNFESPMHNINEAIVKGFLKPNIKLFGSCKLYEIDFDSMRDKYLLVNDSTSIFFTLDKVYIKKISLENLCLSVLKTKNEKI